MERIEDMIADLDDQKSNGPHEPEKEADTEEQKR